MIDGLWELDDSEVALAFLSFAAGLALLVDSAHSHAQVVQAFPRGVSIIVELSVLDFNNRPTILG